MSKRETFLAAACKDNVEEFLRFIELHVSKVNINQELFRSYEMCENYKTNVEVNTSNDYHNLSNS